MVTIMDEFTKALSCHQAKDLNGAIQGYKACLDQDPIYLPALANLAVAMRELGKTEAAILLYRRVLAHDPNHVDALSNLGGALRSIGQLKDAVSTLESAVQRQPNHAAAWYNLGQALSDIGRPKEAIPAFDEAIKLAPERHDARFEKARSLLLSGQLLQGFEAYESRFDFEPILRQPYTQPLWDGKSLKGKTLLLHSEQGFGDTLQFCRYIPLIEKQGGRIVLECPKELVRLMKSVSGVDEVIEKGQPLPPFDVYCSLLSLPHRFKTTLESIPSSIPYLQPPKDKIKIKENRQFKVGIVWESGHEDLGTHNRSFGIRPFISLLNVPGVQWFSLQKGKAAAELELCKKTGTVSDLSHYLNDFADTASLISQLDLIISVDTAVVHLAGALGKPVWVVLPYSPEWRWMLDRIDSPWYPNTRLFRLQSPDNWTSVFQSIKEELGRLVKTSRKKKSSKKHLVFFHKNYPSQFGPVSEFLLKNYDAKISFFSEGRDKPIIPGTKHYLYSADEVNKTSESYFFSRFFEKETRSMHGAYQAFVRAGIEEPDVLIGHVGFGNLLLLHDLYPEVPSIGFFEIFYNALCTSNRPEYPTLPANHVRTPLRNATQLLELEYCTKGYSPTNFQRSTFPETYQHKLHTLFDGVDTEKYCPGPVTSTSELQKSWPADAKIVTFVARGLEAMRGFDIFMKVAHLVSLKRPDVHFVIAGSPTTVYGSEMMTVKEKTFKEHVLNQAQYDLSRFHFLNWISESALVDLFRLSSCHFYWTTPHTLSWSFFQAMSTGVLMMGSNSEPVRDVLVDGLNGLMVEPYDIEMMVERMLETLDNPKKFHYLREIARETITKDYGFDTCLPKLAEFYLGVQSPRSKELAEMLTST